MARRIPAAWLAALTLAALGARARAGEDGGTPRVRHEVRLTSPEAAADGGLVASGGAASAADGGVRLEGGVRLHLDASRWFPDAAGPEGWAVEARLRPLRESGPCGAQRIVQIEVWDGRAQVIAMIGGDVLGLFSAPGPWVLADLRRGPGAPPDAGPGPEATGRDRQGPAAVPPSGPRTYRLDLRGGRVALAVDGAEVLQAAVAPGGRAGSLGPWPVTFGASQCSGTISEWEWIAWETAPRPIPPGFDPQRMHPAVEVPLALEALSAGLTEKNAAAVRALKLELPALACAARTAVDDAVRLGARRAFEAQLHPPPQGEPRTPPPPPWKGSGGCPALAMSEAEVVKRARFAARTLAKLASTLDGAGLEQAREALQAPSPDAPAKRPPEPDDVLALLGEGKRQGPLCDPAGPCDCRPRPAPKFPYPAEVSSAARAAELVDQWRDHPQHVYDALVAASGALPAPADQARLVAHLKAIASGKRTCWPAPAPPTRP